MTLLMERWDTKTGLDMTIGAAHRKVAVVEEWFKGRYRATLKPEFSLEATGLNYTCNYFDTEQEAINWVHKRWEKFVSLVIPEKHHNFGTFKG